MSALLGAHGASGNKSRRAIKPTREQDLPGKTGNFVRQQNEDCLRDLLGELGITDLSRGGRMNEVDIAVHQGGKCGFRISRHELIDELPVFHNTQ